MGTVDSEQLRAEKLAELGAKLRQARQEKAISLEHIAAKTLIQPRLLSAIEEGNLDQLPEPVYTQGFIRRFADALGLNGAEFANAFPTSTVPPTSNPRNLPQLPTTQLRPIHLYILYIIVIAAAVTGLSYLINLSPNTPETLSTGSPSAFSVAPSVAPSASATASSQPLPPTTTTTGLPSPVATAQPTPPTQSIATPQIPGQGVKVSVELRQNSWMEVVVDDKVVYEGILAAGHKQTWTGKQKLILRAGNAGGVIATANGGTPKAMGQPGAVEEIVYTAPASPSRTVSPTPSVTTVAPTASPGMAPSP